MISFIIPVRDDADHLERCLRSIRTSAAGVAHEIIVVDNGSRDDSVGVVADGNDERNHRRYLPSVQSGCIVTASTLKSWYIPGIDVTMSATKSTVAATM